MPADEITFADRVYGCLLGGALGDALGADVEFLALDDIRARYGVGGMTGFAEGRAAITDDTQMTLFTVEGLLSGGSPQAVYEAYRRWMITQQEAERGEQASWLLDQPAMHHRRAPGNACLGGLSSEPRGRRSQPKNPHSKGCGAVMRSAPFGLLPGSLDDAWQLSIDCAIFTHGHPSGYLAAAAMTAIVHRLLAGDSLPDAVRCARGRLEQEDGAAREVIAALDGAAAAAENDAPTPDTVERIGAGWVAEEALAIGVYCALQANSADTTGALLLAVNHSGDSDSTGAIAGNLVGAAYGRSALPATLLSQIVEVDVVTRMAAEFVGRFR